MKKLEKKQRKAHKQEIHRWFMHAAHNSLEPSHVSILKERGDKSKLTSKFDSASTTERKFNSSYYDAFGEESPFSLLDEKFIEIRWLAGEIENEFLPWLVLGKLPEYHVDFGKEYCWALSNEQFKWCPINVDYVKANTTKISEGNCWDIVNTWLKSNQTIEARR